MQGAKAGGRRSKYHSPLRARQAAQTRLAVIDAATRLFTGHGWAGTTVAAVAAEAGTAVETVYSAFGSKAGLLIAAIDAAIVGGDGDETPLVRRPEFAALGVGDRAARVAAAAKIATGALVRAVPLMGALREAAPSDETVRARLTRYEDDRHATIAMGLSLVLGGRPDRSLVDSIWALAGPEVFVKLTGDRGWSVDRYERWLAETAAALVAGATA